MSNNLVLTFAPAGRNGRGTLTARRGEEVLFVDSLNLSKGKDRADFLQKIMEKAPDTQADTAEEELMRLAATAAAKTEEKPANPDSLPELDVCSIVRPERFIAPEVCGLSVPAMTTSGDKPVGRWKLYLRWANRKRECRPMPMLIDIPDGRRLWIHPTPCEPTANTPRGWSPEGRRQWLAGESAPDPADLFKRLCERFAYFLDLPKDQGPGVVATVTLWTILSYVYLAWPVTPYLYFGGPLGSGKTRVFEILSRVAFRPIGSSNMSGPTLFRTLHSQGGTLLLDEAERLKQTQDPATCEILSMLLAGYKKGGQATRLEPVGDTFKTVSFDVFGPKALACVAGLPPALASRCIPVTMFRAGPGSDKPRRRIDAAPAFWQSLRDDLHALALEHGPTWLELPGRADVCPAMSGRDWELWQPLLALASWVEEHGARGLLSLVQAHAMRTIDMAWDDQVGDADEVLLRLLAERRGNLEAPTPGELLKAAMSDEPAVFKQWSAKGVANVLRRYGVHTSKTRGLKVYSRVSLEELRRIETTYGLALGLPEDSQEKNMDTHQG